MSANSFQRTVQKALTSVILHFYLGGHLKTPVYSAPIANEETFHKPPRELYKGATVHDKMCHFVHLFQRRTF